jgi:hypothetical protein
VSGCRASLLAIVALGFVWSSTAQATTFTVNSSVDVAGYTGNNACETASGNGVCTLRAAVMAANLTTGATIMLPAGTRALTIHAAGADDQTTGDLNVDSDMSIAGAGSAVSIIDASGLGVDSVFKISAGHVVTMSGLTIQNADAGSGLAGGGAIDNLGALTLISVRITNCHALTGGGIQTGFFAASGSLSLVDSTIDHCSANYGGGVSFNGTGALVITDSSVSSNGAVYDGGGIYVYAAAAVTVTGSTISGNLAANGGGIEHAAAVLFTLTNCTVSGNETSNDGGGIRNSGSMGLYNTTVTRNHADADLDGVGTGGGVFNTPLAENQERFTVDGDGPLFSECAGTITSGGYSMVRYVNAAHCTISGVVMTEGALLGSLQANGGSTMTHASLQGSPAVDGGNPSGCTDPLGATIGYDQRGVPRLGRCDIGSYEHTHVGDANGDGTVSVADVFYLINSLFAGGAPPIGSADVNGDGATTVADVFFLINFLFAGGPPPPDVPSPSLSIWLRADAGATNPYCCWVDQGAHRNWGIPVSGQTPLYVASALNGLPVMRFSGAAAMSLEAPPLSSQQFTIVVVGKSAGTGLREFVSDQDAANTAPVFFGQNGSTLRFTDAFASAGAFSPDTYSIFVAVSSATDARTYVNGVLAAAKGSPLPARNLSATWHLGSQVSSEFLDGDIAELLIYDRALSDAERQALEQDLKLKYGL